MMKEVAGAVNTSPAVTNARVPSTMRASAAHVRDPQGRTIDVCTFVYRLLPRVADGSTCPRLPSVLTLGRLRGV
jgi:hypothetical protein